MADPVFDPMDVLARLDALESGLTLKQLPLEPLKTFLENDWQPDSGLLLQPASITTDLLAADSVGAAALDPAALVLRGTKGSGTVTFPSSTLSTVTLVPHGLGVVPAQVFVTVAGNFNAWVFRTAKDATNISVRMAEPTASTDVVPFDWVALL